ncbi:hypothetical protein EHQ31_11110 [Leptospira montravelensis]|uniref:Uncharacterized protein n=1 Tax=Leptospira montravelensis TaxID=2484961 RepID=A0ABY2LS44_9LEPT|nr:hypothetical protein [Leptospira montravelensis]TGK81070.1 hypothetical protein EHQ19_15710 [Leptospira montravelensis]TGL01335.1 hypothetical protein EHQ31_11110 [Leptospira montravelensis]
MENHSKESAFCIDVPNQNYLIPGLNTEYQMVSGIYPCDDVDYFKVNFKNQKFALDYRAEAANWFHILLENSNDMNAKISFKFRNIYFLVYFEN